MPVNEQTREFRKANNLCPRDGRPNALDRKMCDRCLKKSAEKTERHRQKKKDAGLCLACGIRVDNVKFCDNCRMKTAESSRKSHIKWYGLRKEVGQCTSCGGDAVEGKVACQKCLDNQAASHKAMNDRNRANGKCSQCGSDLGNAEGKRCQTCIEKRNAWYQGSTTQEKDKARRDENKEAVLKHYGGKCVTCGMSRPSCLAIDHIHGDGNTHRKKIGKWGSGFFKWLVDNNFPEGFQILCHNCNMIKHIEGDDGPPYDLKVSKGICR